MYKESKRVGKRRWLLQNLCSLFLIFLFGIIANSLIAYADTETRTEQEKKLNDIVMAQKVLGVSLPTGAAITWSVDDQITAISWNDYDLKGTVDFTVFPALTSLNIRGNGFGGVYTGGLTDIKVNGLKELKILNCYGNQLSNLDLEGIEELTSLNCSYNSMKSIDVGENAKLTTLNCSYNELTNLHLEGLANLTNLNFSSNTNMDTVILKDLANLSSTNIVVNDSKIKSMILEGLDSVTSFVVNNLDMSSLTVKNITQLTILDCSNNKLKSLVLESLPAITKLQCDYNELEELDLTGIKATLQTLYCRSNKLIDLDINELSELVYLNASSNKTLQELNIKGLPLLQEVYIKDCYEDIYPATRNRLNELTLSELPELITLDCSGNKLEKWTLLHLPKLNSNLTVPTMVKELTINKMDTLTTLNLNSHGVEKVTCSALPSLENLHLDNNKLTNLDLHSIPSLVQVNCDNNQLTSINVTGLSNVNIFKCSNNLLTNLNISDMTKLVSFECMNNLLTSLDLSKQKKVLQMLECEGNQLTSLDLDSDFIALTWLSCGNNKIDQFILPKLPELVTLYYYGSDLNSSNMFKVSDMPKLSTIYFQYSNIENVVISDNKALSTISYIGGKLKKCSFLNLPKLSSVNGSNSVVGTLKISGLPLVSAITGTNWFNGAIVSNLEIGNMPALVTVNCPNIGLESITFSELSKVTTLTCNNNKLTALELKTMVPQLTSLVCNDNYMTGLDLDGMYYLATLNCQNNYITALKLNNAASVVTLNCYNNQLTKLDVSKMVKLQTLSCYRNKLTQLILNDETDQFAEEYALKYVYCYDNKLTALRAVNLPRLSALNCYNNELSELILETVPNLSALNCNNNNLVELKLKNLSAFMTLNCMNNQLQTIQLEELPVLATLNCMNNNLTVLTFKNTPNIATLNCNNNQLATIDVSELTNVTMLDFGKNELKTLDVNNLRKLSALYCNQNALTSLNISNLDKLSTLNCFQNQLKALKLNNLIALSTVNAYDNRLTTLDFTNTMKVKDLDIHSNALSSLDVSKYYELQTLHCEDNSLTSLEIGNLINLTALYCQNNQLTSLDISHARALVELYCSSNSLTSLVLNGFSDLTKLDCSNNQLTALDLKDLSALEELYCKNNQIKTLDFSNNKKLLVKEYSVFINVEAIALVKQIALKPNETYSLEAGITPNDATNKTVMWSSSNELVATVSNTGLVTAIGNGTADIVAKTEDGSKTAKCTVSVKVPMESVSLDIQSKTVTAGVIVPLHATVYPSDAANQDVVWTSSDTEVATVDNTGKVTTKTAGKAVITVTSVDDSSKKAVCRITVIQPVIAITLSDSEILMKKGGIYPLSVGISPANATNKNVIWKSSDKEVAVVTDTGFVIAIGNGIATITVETEDGRKTVACTVTVTTSVEDVYLDYQSKTILVGSNCQLNAMISPATASNKAVSWSSSNTKVATIDDKGFVTAVATGTAMMAVRTEDGEKIKTCEITVVETVKETPNAETPNAETMTLNHTMKILDIGNVLQLNATITPTESTDKKITWSSSDTNIVTVDDKGMVIAKNAGEAVITAELESGSTKAICMILVPKPSQNIINVTDVKLNKTAVSVAIGKTYQLSTIISPSDATEQYVLWLSSNASVATVSDTGKVNAKKVGKTTITAITLDGKKTVSCVVTVTQPVMSVKLNKKSVTIKKGKTYQLKAIINPTNATNKKVTWKSSKTSIATVSSQGKIKAKKKGTVTITVTTVDGKKKAKCTIKIK